MADRDDIRDPAYDAIFELPLSDRFRDIRAVVALALSQGWVPIEGKGIMMVAKDGTKINLPRNSHLKQNVFRHHVHSIITHKDEPPHEYRKGVMGAPLAVIMDVIIERLRLDHDHARIMRDAIPKVEKAPVPPAQIGGNPAAEPAPGDESIPAPVVTHGDPQGARSLLSDEEAEAEVQRIIAATSQRHIVSTEPWSAHGRRSRTGDSMVYPSEAVMQRNWSDGTKDYACRYEGCDYVRDIARPVANHYGAVHSRGQGVQPKAPEDGIDPDFTHTTAQKRRISKLRAEIDAAMTAAFDVGAEADAIWIATWIVEHRADPQREEGDSKAGRHGYYNDEGEWVDTPIGPDEILEELASLLERHTGRSKVLREQIEAQDSVLQRYQQERDLAVARAERAEGNLHALRDMLNEADG
jgi:hypothetical protein